MFDTIIGWSIGIPIGLGVGYLVIRYIYYPMQDRQFARQLYGEDHLCKKQLHEPMCGDHRCMKKNDKTHCCHCEKMFCKWEWALEHNCLSWYYGKKKGLLKYIKKYNLKPYPTPEQVQEIERKKDEEDRQLYGKQLEFSFRQYE